MEQKVIPNTYEYVKQLIKLLKEFVVKDDTTPLEYIEEKLEQTQNYIHTHSELFENFILLMKHKEIFEIVVQNYWDFFGLKSFNKEMLTVLFFVLIFGLNKDNYNNVLQIFQTVQYKFILNVAQYFTVEENLVEITQAACKVYDNEYVLEVILHPILNKCAELKKLYEEIRDGITKLQPVPKAPTKPVGPTCLQKQVSTPNPPGNTPEIRYRFKSKNVPKVVLDGDKKLQRGLGKAYKENRQKALNLLEYAHLRQYNCAKVPEKAQIEQIAITTIIKPAKMPPKTDVTIKSNNASLMRHAATLVKEKETEIRKIESLTQCVFDPTTLEAFEDELRTCKEQEYLQDIERKHLQGLLTHEEAILAKQNLLKANQLKMEDFKIERQEILAEIELWQQKEQEKIKALVERCQNIERAARNAERKMYEDKKIRAREVECETKELLREAYEKKQEELKYKVRLIQELRAYQLLHSQNVKEFDPTESPNFGLLCEMSIAELQERLGLLKMQLKEELEQRQQAVSECRLKQQRIIESVKQFIDQNKATKVKPVPRAPPKLEQTPDIISLRERLQQARQIRLNAVK